MMKAFKIIFNPHSLAMLTPMVIMATIFIFQGVYPFGNQTLLTVDLGQQYVDFYAAYKQTLPFEWGRLFYSFHKGLGGEMTGLWAYYLMSPLNVIFLAFPLDQIDLAVSLLILLRYGLAALTMSLYLSRQGHTPPLLVILLSTTYALSGYMINYQFNQLWMDGVILLPLIALGVDRFCRKGRIDLYVPTLALALMSNYYIGYMICLFLILFFLYKWLGCRPRDRYAPSLAGVLKLFILGSLLAGGLAAFILIPTALQLPLSKAAHTHFSWEWSWLHSPLDLMAKWTLAAFNFDQLPNGLANIFVSGWVLVLVVAYFFNSSFHKHEKMVAAGVLSFLMLSMLTNPLNKIWHGFQEPNWFPYRFSFVLIFFMIHLAHRQLTRYRPMNLPSFWLSVALGLGLFTYTLFRDLDFIQTPALVISLILFLLYLTLPFLFMKKNSLMLLAMAGLLCFELTANAALSLNELNYHQRDRFIQAQATNRQMVRSLDHYQPFETDFYRIEKTYQRSKNDSHAAAYKGGSHFGSTYEANSYRLFQALGFPAGSGFSSYSNATLFTDSLFNIRYVAADQEVNGYHVGFNDRVSTTPMSIVQSKPDLKHYEPLVQVPAYTIYKNPYALGLAFKVDQQIMDMAIPPNYPIILQNQLARYLDPSLDQPLFFKTPADISYHNLTVIEENGQLIGRPIQQGQAAYVQARLDLTADQAYYYVMKGQNKKEDYEFYVDGEPFPHYTTFYSDVVFNIASAENRQVDIRLELTGEELYLSNHGFYRLDLPRFEAFIQQVQGRSIPIHHYSHGELHFSTRLDHDQDIIALTLPYDESWTIRANGVAVPAVKVMDSLLGIQLPPGSYQIEMTYQTPGLFIGSALSLLSLALLILLALKNKHIP